MIDRAPWLPWLAAGLAAFIAVANLGDIIPGSRAGRVIATHELQAVFAFALLLPCGLWRPSRGFVRRLLANRVLLWVGLVSYGLYLWHVVVNFKLVEWGVFETRALRGVRRAGARVTLLLAAASFYGSRTATPCGSAVASHTAAARRTPT